MEAAKNDDLDDNIKTDYNALISNLNKSKLSVIDENKAYLTLKQMQHEREVHIRAHEVIKTILQINKSNKVKKTSYKQDFQIKLNTNKSKKDNKIIEERKERQSIRRAQKGI